MDACTIDLLAARTQEIPYVCPTRLIHCSLSRQIQFNGCEEIAGWKLQAQTALVGIPVDNVRAPLPADFFFAVERLDARRRLKAQDDVGPSIDKVNHLELGQVLQHVEQVPQCERTVVRNKRIVEPFEHTQKKNHSEKRRKNWKEGGMQAQNVMTTRPSSGLKGYDGQRELCVDGSPAGI
jgi:hypothetical protein